MGGSQPEKGCGSEKRQTPAWCLLTSLASLWLNYYFTMTLVMEMEPQEAECSHRDVHITWPHPPASRSQPSPTWHTPVALGMLGWAGGVCMSQVRGQRGRQSHQAGALAQPRAAVTHLSVTTGLAAVGGQCSEPRAALGWGARQSWGWAGTWAGPGRVLRGGSEGLIRARS